jgi:hypothetical protein
MSETMKQAFGLVRRPWGIFYLKHKITGEQKSLKTSDKHEAQRILAQQALGHNSKAVHRAYPRGCVKTMKTRYRLTRRGIRGNKFYCVDTTTGKRTSLRTANEDEARQIVEARNNSERQPVLNLQIAKAYLAGTDNGIATRTWQQAIESLTNTKQGANQHRWRTAAKDKAFVPLMPRIIIETPGELLLKVLQAGKVSTNVFLRRLHNFCVDMNWLPWPLIPKRQWPAVKFKEKRAITFEEHQKIIAAEMNPERKALYQLCWHLGGSQGDIANLKGEDVDWTNGTVSFVRKKNRRAGHRPLGRGSIEPVQRPASRRRVVSVSVECAGKRPSHRV